VTVPTENPGAVAEADGPPLARIEERLAELVDLFRRRLLDDRDKRRLIDAATDRAQAAESGPFRQYLHPLVVGLAMVIDRLDAYQGADPDFAASVRDELLDALARQGVVPVATDGPIDPSRHDVLAVTGPLGTSRDMVVAQVEGRGYRHADWVFRPARVTATARADDELAG
jgi:molecular chaperone GrpE (heat shock protein)